MSETQPSELERILDEQLRTMAAVLRPATIKYYRTQANRFLRYIRLNHPDLRTPGQILRNPHILGWLRSLGEENPPLTNRSRRAALICVRRLLEDMADNGHPVHHPLILSQDMPPRDLYLPKPVTPEVDQLLSRELQKTDDLLCNALLLIRATGMRVGECLRLTTDSMRHLGANQWALHVPIGKLHNERWVPLDDDARAIFGRILSLGDPQPARSADSPNSPLLLRSNGKSVSYGRIKAAPAKAAKRAGCPTVRPHQLRHTYATAMLRAGISLAALKEILRHRDIRMTIGYVQVTQKDLQREYHQARLKMVSVHAVPQPPNPIEAQSSRAGIPAICDAVDALKHQIEMYARMLSDEASKRKLHSLARRLAKLRTTLASLQPPEEKV